MIFKNKSKLYKSAKFFPLTGLKKEHLVSFGTVFFVSSLVLLFGLFLFPSVRVLLHDSAVATGLAPASVLSGEALPTQIFSDVDSGHPNAEAIAYLKKNHVIEGYSDNSFKPDNFVTRAELLKFLFEAQKVYPSQAVYRACFKDAHDEWFAPYVCYAKAKGLVQGYSDGRFDPAGDVTAAAALKVILAAYNVKLLEESPSENMKFDDGAWYAPYVWTAYARQLVTWETVVDPQKVPNLTRGTVTKALLKRSQLAEILYRFMK